jgi:hypothetical protein
MFLAKFPGSTLHSSFILVFSFSCALQAPATLLLCALLWEHSWQLPRLASGADVMCRVRHASTPREHACEWLVCGVAGCCGGYAVCAACACALDRAYAADAGSEVIQRRRWQRQQAPTRQRRQREQRRAAPGAPAPHPPPPLTRPRPSPSAAWRLRVRAGERCGSGAHEHEPARCAE